MNTSNTAKAQQQTSSSPSPERVPPEQGGQAYPDGERAVPIHPDDIDADGEPLGDGKATRNNPLADSPDDGE